MPRSDVHRDVLARELGVTVYQSAHGKAADTADLAERRLLERRGTGMPMASPGSTTADGSSGSGMS